MVIHGDHLRYFLCTFCMWDVTPAMGENTIVGQRFKTCPACCNELHITQPHCFCSLTCTEPFLELLHRLQHWQQLRLPAPKHPPPPAHQWPGLVGHLDVQRIRIQCVASATTQQRGITMPEWPCYDAGLRPRSNAKLHHTAIQAAGWPHPRPPLRCHSSPQLTCRNVRRVLSPREEEHREFGVGMQSPQENGIEPLLP